jgi:hypothetical protein
MMYALVYIRYSNNNKINYLFGIKTYAYVCESDDGHSLYII